MNVIAMYLPQFHRVKENDEWWGQGFTEWTAVKGANKLFDEHYQPRVPQNKNYYDLLEKDTMMWQAALMKKYGVDGICMYHYWFKDGRQILEKPAENLLEWQDVDMPFCFCWANQTWARSWSNFQNVSVWSTIYEKEGNVKSKEILLEQNYGNELRWKQHFEYLLPFFCDKRYICVEGKPLFLILGASDIPCLTEMLECWRKSAVEHGLNGIYVVGYCNSEVRKGLDAELIYEPSRALQMCSPMSISANGGKGWEYDAIWNSILAQKKEGKIYFEGVVDFDDSPRRGKDGRILLNASPEKFEFYLTELMAKSSAYHNDIVFINAWNEWGEGMYLEPDEKYGERYLQAISNAKEKYMTKVNKYVNVKSPASDKNTEALEKLRSANNKNLHYLLLLNNWMILREKGITLADKLLSAGYKSVGIYGYGITGRHLLNELVKSTIIIKCIIDQKKDWSNIDGIGLYHPTEEIPDVDAIIVSATYYYDEIYQMLKNRVKCRIISLETLLYEDELN